MKPIPLKHLDIVIDEHDQEYMVKSPAGKLELIPIPSGILNLAETIKEKINSPPTLTCRSPGRDN